MIRLFIQPGRLGSTASIFVSLAAAFLFGVPANAQSIQLLTTPHGPMRLSLPYGPGPHPVVIVLPDRPAADLRAEPYIDRLIEGGIAVLEAGLDDADEASVLLTTAGLRMEFTASYRALLDKTRIGYLGFGAGGRTALNASADIPVAAIYPSCEGLRPSRRDAPTLLLHPDNPAESAACHFVTPDAKPIPGATHGWDHRQGAWDDGVALLPHPDGSRQRIRSQGSGWATGEAATRVLRHFSSLPEWSAP